MTAHESDYNKVVQYLQTLGVEVVQFEGDFIKWLRSCEKTLRQAPFTNDLAVNWEKRQIVYSGDKHPWPHLVHEAGHLLATRFTPENSNELHFLGWEMAFVQHLKLSMEYWHKNNSDYGIDQVIDSVRYNNIGSYPYDSIEFDQLVAHFVNDAKNRGIVTDSGIPLVHRSRQSKTKEAA